MKAEIKNKKNKKHKNFDPVTIQITIENEDELFELWHRMNFAEDKIRRLSKSWYKTNCPEFIGSNVTVLWGKIDRILRDYKKPWGVK